ncbi:MAG: hypothetical protein U0353_30870 [Sandaracinus sp.]
MTSAGEMAPGAVGDRAGRMCATIGCEAILPTGSPRMALYCRRCRLVLEAIYDGGEVWDASLRALGELAADIEFVPPYPAALPCVGCSFPRAALPGVVWCSPKCQRSIRSFVHRGLRLANLGGVVLPEKMWRHLRGLGGGTYRERRLRLGVIGALLMPLDAGRSRSARAGVATRRGLPSPEDGLALRDLIRSMTPRIRTFT